MTDTQYNIFHQLISLRGGFEIGHISQVMRVAGFIRHDPYIFSSDAIATVIFIELDLLLQHHDQLFGFRMLFKEFLNAVKLVNAFPSSSGKWFHIGGKTYVFENTLPIQGISQVREGFMACIGG